jgi:hypothetical protein
MVRRGRADWGAVSRAGWDAPARSRRRGPRNRGPGVRRGPAVTNAAHKGRPGRRSAENSRHVLYLSVSIYGLSYPLLTLRSWDCTELGLHRVGIAPSWDRTERWSGGRVGIAPSWECTERWSGGRGWRPGPVASPAPRRESSPSGSTSATTSPPAGAGAGPSAVGRLALLLDLGRLAGAVAQVVKLRPPDVAPGNDVDLGDHR